MPRLPARACASPALPHQRTRPRPAPAQLGDTREIFVRLGIENRDAGRARCGAVIAARVNAGLSKKCDDIGHDTRAGATHHLNAASRDPTLKRKCWRNHAVVPCAKTPARGELGHRMTAEQTVDLLVCNRCSRQHARAPADDIDG
jgi:hypothetical protein